MLPDAEPLLEVEMAEVDPDRPDEAELEAPVPEPLGLGAPEAGLLVEIPPEEDVPEPAGASVPAPPVVAVEGPGFGATSEPEVTVVAGTAEPAPAELEASGASKAEDPE